MRLGLDVRAALWYRASGIGTYTNQLWRNLAAAGTREYELVPLGERLKTLDIETPEVRLKKINFWQALQDDAGHLLKGIDIYHNPQNGFGMPQLNPHIPLVVTIHDLIPYILPQTCSRAYLKLFLELVPKVVERAQAIIAVSKQTKEDILNIFHIREDKIRVIYEAAEPVYKPKQKNGAAENVLLKYGLKGNYFLHVGGFSRRKNALTVIKCFSRLCKKLGDWQLALVGRPGGGCFEECVRLIEYYNLKGKVILTGLVSVEEMPYLYGSSRALIYPSLYEGFGLPLVEAMACGIPCIAGCISSMPEIVGDSAILVNPYEPQEIEDAMWRIATDKKLAGQLVSKGQMRIKNYSWQKTAAETLNVYAELAGRPGAGQIEGNLIPPAVMTK